VPREKARYFQCALTFVAYLRLRSGRIERSQAAVDAGDGSIPT
jgi:hypothetical protein